MSLALADVYRVPVLARACTVHSCVIREGFRLRVNLQKTRVHGCAHAIRAILNASTMLASIKFKSSCTVAVACRNKTRSQKIQSTMQKHVQLDLEDNKEEELSQLNNLKEKDIQLLSSKLLMEVRDNGQRVWMELDTGAAVSVTSQKI